MAADKIGYDSLYKRALGNAHQLAQFLRAFDPQTAALLRLESIEPRGEARGVLRAKRAWLKEDEDVATRFGALSPEVAARIDAIEDEGGLDAVKRRLATVASPDQLFA